MSDEAYDIDGDVSRFLQTPPPESHLLAVAAADDEPAAPHDGAPQDPPAGVHQVGLVLQTPPLNPEPAPANDVGNRQAPTMDVEPPPPRDPVPAARATTHPTPSFEALFDDIVLPDLGTMSLYDELMDDGDDEEVEALIRSVEDAGNTGALAEHSVPPAEEDLDFVPFVCGQLDCSNCRSVREVLHESANPKLHFAVHVADPGTFQHAIFDRTYIDADGQIILNEMCYLDLRQRTHEWVKEFIANTVEMLNEDTSGQLRKDSSSAFHSAVCTNASTPAENDAHRELELDMLKHIFSSPTAPTEAVAPQFAPEAPQPARRAEENNNADGSLLGAANWHGAAGLSRPAILESFQVAVQYHGVGSCTSASHLAKQRKRTSGFPMEDVLNRMHMTRKDAAKELNISATSLKRLCRKNNTNRWPGRKIISINNKIKKLEEAARKNVGMIGLLAFKEKLDKLKLERAQLYSSVVRGVQENEKHNGGGAGSSGSK
ncbi:hypothetical protein C2845_PM12G12680 [Panicum miliaceum]|uniref:RWP-RK domain-containing protein n=1 Tax=Panicum miliaceum TaxID=4540 RepID=A0A3L6QGT9_PANMI|nr:hypothetical protein C2845_PM12G12680 [Panicum miliaceum]